jgi:hyperosmotically inducible periplasmic protein
VPAQATAARKLRKGLYVSRATSRTGFTKPKVSLVERQHGAPIMSRSGRGAHYQQSTKWSIAMKTTQFLKAAGGIACVVFALNVNAQTNSTASSSGSTDTSVGQKVDDSTVTAKVKAELLSAKDVKSTHIHVKTKEGVVWLTGSVPSASDKTAAEETVKNVSGVASVKNRLKIAAK